MQWRMLRSNISRQVDQKLTLTPNFKVFALQFFVAESFIFVMLGGIQEIIEMNFTLI